MSSARVAVVAALVALGCTNSPRGDCNPDPEPGVVGSICGFRNPEDLAVVPELDILVVSQMRDATDEGGSLVYLSLGDLHSGPHALWPVAEPTEAPAPVRDELGLDPACDSPPARGFSPHGLAVGPARVDGTVLLAVVSHAPREAVEVFALEPADPIAARWLGCARLPGDAVGNDVAFAARGELFVTDYQPTDEGLAAAWYAVLSGLGFDTGAVLHRRPGGEWERIPDSGGANPNGLLSARDGSLVYFAQTGSGRIGVSALGTSGAARRDIRIEGYPDNLAWSGRGTILAVTHTEGFGVLLCRFGRTPCHSAWSLIEIDPQRLRTRRLLHHDGTAVGAAASVAPVGARYYFGAVFGDRIGVWSAGDGGDGVLHNGWSEPETKPSGRE